MRLRSCARTGWACGFGPPSDARGCTPGARRSSPSTPRGRASTTGDAGSVVKVWDLAAAKLVHQLDRLAAGWGAGLAFVRGGRTLVTGSKSGQLRAFDTATGSLAHECKPTSDEVRALARVGDAGVVALNYAGSADTWTPGDGAPSSRGLVRSTTSASRQPL